MARRYYRNGSPETTLTGGINGAATSIPVVAVTSWPSTRPYTAVIDYGLAGMEVVLVTNVVGTTLTVVRGYDGTAGVSHSAGAKIQPAATAIDYDEASAHINSSTGVHGLAGTLVDTTTSQTLSGKTLAAPTLTGTTTAGTVVAAAVTTSGNTSVTGQLGVGGPATLAGVTASSLAVTGNETVGGTLGVSGTTTAAQVNATGLVVSGNAAVSGTLGVTGATTLGAVAVTSGTVAAAPSGASDIVNKAYADDAVKPPVFRALQTTGQTLSNSTLTTLMFPAEDFDTDSGHSTVTSTSRYVAPKNGYYRVTGTAVFLSVGAVGERSVRLAKNGSDIYGTWRGTNASNALMTADVSDIVSLGVADYVELRAFQVSGGNLSLGSGLQGSTFVVEYIRGW